MATTVVGGHAGRLRTIQDALTPKEWGKVGAMAGIVICPQRARLGDAGGRYRSPLPPEQDGRLRARDRCARLHARDAPRVRRGPHLGHRQHDPQAHGRRQAPAQRRVLLLTRSLDDRVPPGRAAQLRDPCPRRPGEVRGSWGFTSGPASSAPRCRVSSSISSPGSTSSSSSRSSRSSATFARASSTTRSSTSNSNKRGLMNRFFGASPAGSTRRGRCTRSESSSGSVSTPPPKWRCSCCREQP